MFEFLRLLLCKRWVRQADTAAATSTTVSSVTAPDSCAKARFVRLQFATVDHYVEIGNSVNAPADPNTGSILIKAGVPEVLQCRQGGTPIIKVKAASATGTFAPVWGL